MKTFKTGTIECDVAVVGAGIAGCASAQSAAEAGAKAVLETESMIRDNEKRLETAKGKAETLRSGVEAIGQLKTLRYSEEVEKYGAFVRTKKNELHELRERGTYNGFLPNRRYLDRLKQHNAAALLARRAYRQALDAKEAENAVKIKILQSRNIKL